MKFVCNKEELQKGIGIVIRATYNKFQKSILECIHMKTEDHSLILESFDTVTGIKTKIYADIIQPGESAIPARIFSEMISKFPEGEITFERKGQGVSISCNNANAVLQEMDAEQFPSFPEISGSSISLKQSELKKMVDGTAFSTYVGEDKPIFTGLLFEAEGDTVNVVGIDGIRLAKNTIHKQVEEKIRAVIPAKTLREASRILGDEDQEITLSFAESNCFLICDEIQIYTRLLDGDFMNYNSIIPNTYKTRVRVETKMMQRSLELASVLAKEDSSNLIKMSIDSSSMELCSNSEYGASENSIPIFMEGEVLKIAFNSKYLLDVFKVIEDESVFLELDSRLKPCIIRPIEGDAYLYMVVPVNVKE